MPRPLSLSPARLLGLAMLTLTACSGSGTSTPDFVALTTDFADYMTWEKVILGDGDLIGHPSGYRLGYRKKKPVNGIYPVGSMMLKVITVDSLAVPDGGIPDGGAAPVLGTVEMFSMVKRGGDYNSAGAVGWEYFTIRPDANGVPQIVTRGENPADPDSAMSTSHGYGEANAAGITCNQCHGTLSSALTDHILSPVWP